MAVWEMIIDRYNVWFTYEKQLNVLIWWQFTRHLIQRAVKKWVSITKVIEYDTHSQWTAFLIPSAAEKYSVN